MDAEHSTVTDPTSHLDRAFVGWGEDINQFDYKDLWEYDAVNNVWIQRPDTGSKRVYPFIFVIDNLAYIGGGYDPAGGNSYPVDLNKFDISKLSADGTGSPWSPMKWSYRKRSQRQCYRTTKNTTTSESIRLP